MPTLPYDAASHTLYVTTHDSIVYAVEGEPDGDNFLLTFVNEAVAGTEGAKEDVQWSIRGASMATLTKTIQWGSDSNKVFNKIFADQKKNLFIKKVELKRINDLENVLVMTSARGFIGKTPDYGIGVEAANRPWGLKLEKARLTETQDPA